MRKYSQKEVLAYCINNKVSFSISRQPGDVKDVLLISDDVQAFDIEQLSEFINKDGYIIAPFSFEKDKAIFLGTTFVVYDEIDEDAFIKIRGFKSSEEIIYSNNYYADYESYLNQFNQLFYEIKSKSIKKAILSRVKHVNSFSKDNAIELYYKLISLYPNAYLFMYYTSYSGLWIGATPELLLKTNDNIVQTVSLAGTRKLENVSVDWNEKEVEEQKIVSDYMETLLDKYQIESPKIEGPVSVSAGKISHLKTIYNFTFNEANGSIHDFIIDLHPTPAVCGLPKMESMNVIHDVERHKRSYYSGFVGRVEDGQIGLYVNIRSLKFVNDGVDLYLGGGITEGSDPVKEWQETELKAGTLLDVIQDLNKK